MKTIVVRFMAALAVLGLALSAVAATEAGVAADASDLLAAYQALDQRVDACPGGECSDATSIRNAFAALELRRTQLHADRATLPPNCGCQAIDASIAALDQLGDAISLTIAGWDEES